MTKLKAFDDNPTHRSIVRYFASEGGQNSVSVLFVDKKNKTPEAFGSRGGWYTRGGTPINHPSAYSSKGWSNMVYRTCERMINVGIGWLRGKTPKGMTWYSTVDGPVLIRDSDGMEYHPRVYDASKTNFISFVRRQMAKNWKLRLETRKIETKIKNDRNIFITLLDSRKAGNCVQGTLNFAKNRLHLSEKEVVDAPWLVQVPSRLALRVAQSEFERSRVIAATKQAWLRETAISI